jgi:hypothetical protein
MDTSDPTADSPKSSRSRRPHFALVLGNSDYEHLEPLGQCSVDATDVATLLTKLGYQVLLSLNTTRATLRSTFGSFCQQLQAGCVVLVYYSGHGCCLGGTNYLVPVDGDEDAGACVCCRSFFCFSWHVVLDVSSRLSWEEISSYCLGPHDAPSQVVLCPHSNPPPDNCFSLDTILRVVYGRMGTGTILVFMDACRTHAAGSVQPLDSLAALPPSPTSGYATIVRPHITRDRLALTVPSVVWIQAGGRSWICSRPRAKRIHKQRAPQLLYSCLAFPGR